jgi:AraC-like DNA-binding protein
MGSLSIALTAAVVAAYGAAVFLRRLLAPIERALTGPARSELERTQKGLKQIALSAGFASIDVMRRAFVRLLGTTPRRYRELANHPSTIDLDA